MAILSVKKRGPYNAPSSGAYWKDLTKLTSSGLFLVTFIKGHCEGDGGGGGTL